MNLSDICDLYLDVLWERSNLKEAGAISRSMIQEMRICTPVPISYQSCDALNALIVLRNNIRLWKVGPIYLTSLRHTKEKGGMEECEI